MERRCSARGLQYLQPVGSVAVARWPGSVQVSVAVARGLSSLWHVESSQTRD